MVGNHCEKVLKRHAKLTGVIAQHPKKLYRTVGLQFEPTMEIIHWIAVATVGLRLFDNHEIGNRHCHVLTHTLQRNELSVPRSENDILSAILDFWPSSVRRRNRRGRRGMWLVRKYSLLLGFIFPISCCRVRNNPKYENTNYENRRVAKGVVKGTDGCHTKRKLIRRRKHQRIAAFQHKEGVQYQTSFFYEK